MKTAEDFIEYQEEHYADKKWIMIEFAKYHVKQALKKASEEATAGGSDGYYSSLIDKDSILKSYSLDGIV